MSGTGKKSLKRKFENDQDDDIEKEKNRAPKESKTDAASKAVEAAITLTVLKLSPEDWAFTEAIVAQYDNHEVEVEEPTKEGFVSRKTTWKGGDIQHHNDRLSPQVHIACERYPNGSRFDCETQTYHFKPISCASKCSKASYLNTNNEVSSDKTHGVYISCCVKACGSKLSERESPFPYYYLPSNSSERLQWAEILGVEFNDASVETKQAICSKHFLPSKSTFGREISMLTKSKTRKKRTCDILIAEEAEIVKQSMVTGRSKRTPKPNRNYDWAELLPLIKSESDLDLPEPKSSVVRVQNETGRRRKQTLTDIKVECESVLLDDDFLSEEEGEDYGAYISMPSMPRERPPKSKGRPNKIRDTCTQTERVICASPKPLREVKVQCNLTGEPLVSCSSCSNIDWKSLEDQLIDCISLIEGALCDSLLVKCFKKILNDVSMPSHASNILKILAGLERDILESAKDIVLVSNEEDFEEVEIENIIHQEEAPLTGVKVITPKVWHKVKAQRDRMKNERHVLAEDDLDSLGLQEATDKDDEEFKPDYDTLEEDEVEGGDDNLEEMIDDDDWDIKKDGDSRSSVAKKKRPLQKIKKGRQSLGREIEDQEEAVNETIDDDIWSSSETETKSIFKQNSTKIFVTKDGQAVIRSIPKIESQNIMDRKANRKAGDDRWRRGSFKCSVCDKYFTTRLKRDRHYQHHHLGISPWKGTHLCEECGKTFTQKIGLRVHRMHKHSDPKLFQCTICSHKAVSKAKLTRHIMTHYDEKLYSCEICGASLKTQDTYRNHMTLHTNEGKYRCDICQKSFYHKQYYEDHRKSHFNVRDYQCEVCNTMFKTHKSLRTHVRSVHLNDKRIVCGVCGARFMTNYNLRSHMKKHQRAEQNCGRFSCDFCSHRFHSDSGLDIHKKLAHPEYYQPIQIKIDSSNTVEMNSLLNNILTSKESLEVQKDSEVPYAPVVEHIIDEDMDIEVGENCVEIPDTSEDCDSMGPVEIVEAVVEDSGGGVPKEYISVAYVFPCNTCGSMFRSQDLLNFHRHSMHLM